MESVVLGLVLVVVGLPTAVIGNFAVRRRLDLNLGGWTAENAEPDSYDEANRRIGNVMRYAGIVMVLCGMLVLIVGRGRFALVVGMPVLILGAVAMTVAAVREVSSIRPR